MKCKICENKTIDFDRAIILGKYEANYQRCPTCGFICTENPFWLNESYEKAIARTDIGTVSRTETNSRQTKLIIELFFDPSAKFLDYRAYYKSNRFIF